MRSLLAPYRGQRIRAAAEVAGISRKGYVILTNVQVPGGSLPYCWVPVEEFVPGRAVPGLWVPFEAEVRPYHRATDNSRDFGLFNCTEAEP
jgi:hypothetical protein